MDSLERGAEALDKIRQAKLAEHDLSSSNTVGDAQLTQPQQLCRRQVVQHAGFDFPAVA